MGDGLEWECPRQRQGGPRCPALGEGSWSLSEDGQRAQEVRCTPVLLWAALLTSPVTCESPCAESSLSGQTHAWDTRNVVLKKLGGNEGHSILHLFADYRFF